jgi:outer membrane protein TolC
MHQLRLVGIFLGSVLAWPPAVHAQAVQDSPPAEVFTLDAALQYALDHYPTVRAALEEVNVSTGNVRIAQSAYLPRLDAIWQTNRATANNVFGQTLPQSVLPSISGPVLPSESSQSVWGSAVGALFGWEPVDFGLRAATVRVAETGVVRARAEEALTKLDVQQAVGDAFLAVVGAQQAVAAAEADVQRRDVLARAARALADNQLRPGADASRANAERAAAETRAIQARQMLVIAQTTLRRVLGITAGAASVNAGRLLDVLPPSSPVTMAAAEHPLAQSRRAAIDVARAEEDVLAKTDRPRLYLQSSIFARGSGADPSGSFDGSVHGLGLDRTNWAAGVQVVFPNLFDLSSLRARRAASASSTRAQTARYDEALLTVTGQQQTADALADAARAIAANTPVQLSAARESEAQARARYDAGLASIVEVAEAQALLVQAEYQNAAARVDVWRALLAQAVARGNVGAFIELVRGSGVP